MIAELRVVQPDFTLEMELLNMLFYRSLYPSHTCHVLNCFNFRFEIQLDHHVDTVFCQCYSDMIDLCIDSLKMVGLFLFPRLSGPISIIAKVHKKRASCRGRMYEGGRRQYSEHRILNVDLLNVSNSTCR